MKPPLHAGLLDVSPNRRTTTSKGLVPSRAVAAQVTLLARFYERLADHAVNLTRRMASFHN